MVDNFQEKVQLFPKLCIHLKATDNQNIRINKYEFKIWPSFIWKMQLYKWNVLNAVLLNDCFCISKQYLCN